jgi:hypothetical protein
MNPPDPGKCAQPILLRGARGREGKGKEENKFARSAWSCVLVLLLLLVTEILFCKRNLGLGFHQGVNSPRGE